MEIFLLVVFNVFNTLFTNIHAAPAMEQPTLSVANKALMYLTRYGYVDPAIMNAQNGDTANIVDVRQSIMEFQSFAGLEQTGELDEKTIIKMNTPRCGVRDKVGYGSNARKKRYALQGSRWKVSHLTYRVTKYPKRLTRAETDRDIAKAFKVWEDYTDLTFSKWVSGKVHIEIRFEVGEHGDGDPFDGMGGTLAHAYFPIYGGDAHFDDHEIWTVDSYRGTNLLQVAAHEFGHSLGLSHSDVQSALMAPFYRGYEEKIILDKDDILGIEALYGKKTYKPAPKPRIPTEDPTINEIPRTKPTSPLCRDSSFDAITSLGNGKTYVFKGEEFWLLSEDAIAEGYPKRIKTHFIGLPTNIDAAFTWTNKKTYFFKGSKYYRFTDFEMDEGYPKDMSSGFLGVPDNVDGAFVWSGNGKIYFFKGAEYYKFDPEKRPPVASKYPKDVQIWEGIPYYIDDALMYTNGYTYFFKDGKYWRFNDRSFRIDNADPPFPRPVGSWWFGCPESLSSTLKFNGTSGASSNSGGSSSPGGAVHTSPDYMTRPDDLYHDDSYYTDNDYDYWSSIPNNKVNKLGRSGSPASPAFHSLTLSWFTIPVLFRIILL